MLLTGFMNRLIILVTNALLCTGIAAQDKTVVTGRFDAGDAPKEVTFFYRSGESVDVPVVNGRFHVEFPTDVTKSYDVSMGRHVEATIIPEGGTLTISRRPDGRCTVVSDKANSLSVQVDSLMMFRRKNFRDSVLMINEYKRVISANRNNAVGYVALFFLTNFGNTDPKTKSDLAGLLGPELSSEPRTAALKSDIDALYRTSVGMRFTDVEGVDSHGKTVRLSDYAGKGKTILLDFWSTSCGPCRRAFPGIRELHKELYGKSFDIIGIPLWEDSDISIEMIKEAGMTWRNIIGTGEAAAKLYGITYVPQYLLLAPDGTIVARGGLSELVPLVRGFVGQVEIPGKVAVQSEE